MRRTGAATDSYNKAKDIGRAEQDEYAAMSHDRAATAAKNALLDDEIVAAEVPQRRGDPLQVSQDDGVRPATSAESLGSCVRRSPGRHGHRRVGQPDLRIGQARFKKRRLGVRLSARPFRP